jgi:prevent-host-death family protein
MPQVIAQRQLRNDNARIMAAVRAGETFTITSRGEPVAQLLPLRPGRRTVVALADLIAAVNPSVRVDAAQWRADMDATFDQDIDR